MRVKKALSLQPLLTPIEQHLTIIYTSPREKPLRTDDIVPDSLQHGEEWYHRVILPRQMQLEK